MKLEFNEIQFLQQAINNSDPFASIEGAKVRVRTTKQRLDDLKKQLEIDESDLARLEARDNMILKLQEKLDEQSRFK